MTKWVTDGVSERLAESEGVNDRVSDLASERLSDSEWLRVSERATE